MNAWKKLEEIRKKYPFPSCIVFLVLLVGAHTVYQSFTSCFTSNLAAATARKSLNLDGSCDGLRAKSIPEIHTALFRMGIDYSQHPACSASMDPDSQLRICPPMDYYCLQGISACFEPGFLVRLCKTKKMATPDIMLQVRPEHRVNISFSNVSFQYPAKKKEDIARCGDGFFGFVTNLVKTCYAQHQFQYTAGKIQAGELTAIMGPSGAGKSTFWKALTAHQSGLQLSGNAAVNGEFVSSVLGSVRSLYGYVPQTDILDRDATVEENIRFQAETRLPAAYTEAQVDELVEWLLHHFSIDELRDKTIGEVGSENLSGGQIKRVSLAMEIAARPSLMFLDEPTSGLDSTTTEIVVKTLRGLADGGANILVIIHQPSDSVFNQFDRLILLNTDSHIAYMGARADAVEYFRGLLIEADEPPPACGEADFLMDILSRNKCKKVCMVVFFKMLSNQYVGHSSYLCIDAAEAAVCKKNESSSSSFSSSSSSSSSSPYQLGS